MSHKEESLDEKIARIRKQNEKIEQKKKMIDEEIKDAERRNAVVKLKNNVLETKENDNFGATLYSDQLSPERKTVRSPDDDIWNVKPRPRKLASQNNRTDEEWREERKRIDEERIRRQKANSGSWKREWDADKTASSNDHDDRTSKDFSNRFNRTNSGTERPGNCGAYNFNESKGSYNHYNTNEEDNTQNRWKTDGSFRKTNSERRITANYENRKPVRSDSWRTNVSESDQFNNNASKSFSKNNSRTAIRNIPFSARNSQSVEENWDAAKPNLKINSQNNIQISPFAPKNDQFQVEGWNTGAVNMLQSAKPIPNDRQSIENVKLLAQNQEKERLSIPQYRSRPSFGFNSRAVVSKKASNANNSKIISKPLGNEFKNTGENGLEVKGSETNSAISHDLKNIVIQVGNLGISSSKREVKRLSGFKNEFNIPNFSFNVNTSQEVDSKTSPSYGSMTFERSDLKQSITPMYSENISLPSPIATQLFSNSKLTEIDANSIMNNFTKIVKNDEQSTTKFQSPTVFQFSAVPSKPDFGDIVHNITTPQDVKIVRTIRNENIKVVKEPPMKNIVNESKKTKDTGINKDSRLKTYEITRKEPVRNEKVEDEFEDDDEWDDCSDGEVEEEFI